MLRSLVPFSKLGEILRMLGRSFKAWAEWAEDHPEGAARQLETIARVFKYRSEAYRRQNGWRARRDRKFAEALFAQAKALRAESDRKHVCAVPPGTFKEEEG